MDTILTTNVTGAIAPLNADDCLDCPPMATAFLPDSVNINIARDKDDHEEVKADSYFDVTIQDTFLAGVYDAWCVDYGTPDPIGPFTAKVYSGYDTDTIPSNLIDKPENLNLASWILNQSDILNNPDYTVNEIQGAIWTLVDSGYNSAPEDSQTIANRALSEGAGFVPQGGDQIAVVLAPMGSDGNVGEIQEVIVPVPLPAIDVEKLTNDIGGDRPEEAVGVLPGDEVVWTYEVTNTGKIAIPGSEIEVLDDVEGTPIFDPTSDIGNDGILSSGEVWVYTLQGVAETLSHTIDFDTDPITGDPLAAGTMITDLYESTYGLTISTKITEEDGSFITDWGSMIFDSGNPTGGDQDLQTPGFGRDNITPLGNVLILPERLLEPGDVFGPGDGMGPDDNRYGGTFILDWDEPVRLTSIGLLDVTDDDSFVQLYDGNDNPIDIIAIDGAGYNSAQELDFDSILVGRVDVALVDESAALTSIEFEEVYRNTGIVRLPNVPSVGDEDPSHYVPARPSFSLEKSTNGVDADDLENAVVIEAGEEVTWEYLLTNDGNVALDGADILLEDDKEVIPVLDATSDLGNDGILSPGEQWRYVGTGIAEDLSVNIDWETDADGNELEAGTVIDNEFEGIGVTISTPGHKHGAMIFDTANPTGNDLEDLLDPNIKNGGEGVLGNVLILSQDGNSKNPNDNAQGGTFRFDFEELTGICSVGLFDIDEGETVTFRTFDESGDLINTQVVDGKGDNTIQAAPINSGLIMAMEVELSKSGSISGIEGDRFYSNLGTASVDGLPGLTVTDSSFYVNSESSCVFG